MEGILNDIRDLLILGRFQFLFGGLLLYIVGVMMAAGFSHDLEIWRAVLGYLVFAPGHLSVSYSNDLYDSEADKHNEGSPFSGGSGILQKRPELKRAAFWISVYLMAATIVLSIFYAYYYGITPLFVLFVIGGVLLGWYYTAPPLQLSYRGFGEPATALTVGILVPMYGFFAVSGTLDTELLYFLFPFSLAGLYFIFNVQIPDMEADEKAGKRTWIVRLGRRNSFIMVLSFVILQTLYYTILTFGVSEINGLRLYPFMLMSMVPLLMTLPSIYFGKEDRKESVPQVTANMLSQFIYLGGLGLFLFMII